VNDAETTQNSAAQPLEERVNNRSQRPSSDAFKAFMASNWAPAPEHSPELEAVAGYASARRRAISAQFKGERLVIPAGPLKVRSNDCDYRFRPHSAFAHLTGLGVDHEPDAVLILEPVAEGTGDDGAHHRATLYFRPLAGRDTEQFYADSRSGEFWIGPRPTLAEFKARLGIATAHIDELETAITKNVGAPEIGGVSVRLVRKVDENIDALVDTARYNTAKDPDTLDLGVLDALDDKLSEALSELRLLKDEWEIEQMKIAVAATVEGFTEVVKSLPRALTHHRGERIVEGAFFARAREEGNELGYDTIAASGNNATVLHWTRNTGKIDAGDLLLLDAGVEAESLYTADVTRTLPVNGAFSDVQRKVYEAVLDAADAGFAAARPGTKFRDIHTAATTVLAERLAEWGLLPVSVQEAISPEGQQHRRWMPHGTSHHLGLDVHDCAQAKRDLYLDGVLTPGMVFTIEPGLYFKNEDLAIPEEYRGIGVRIEDDILMTAEGPVNLSAALPRGSHDVEDWMAGIYQDVESQSP
jgi:Xaa-Pro aminopeptidase